MALAPTARRDPASPRRWRAATFTPRGVVMAVGVASFAGAIALAPLVGSEFIPETDQGFTQLSLRMPEGSSLARSDAKVQQIETDRAGPARGGRRCPPGWAARASATRPG